MKIMFLCFSGLEFDASTPYNNPLGGTESAVAYLAGALAARGHDVSIMGKLPALPATTGPCVIRGVKHYEIADEQSILDAIDPDVVVAASAPSAFPGIAKTLPRAERVLWNHMRPDQPAIHPLGEPNVQIAIKHIVYVSEVQKRAFAVLVPRKSGQIDVALSAEEKVINNAIAPAFENLFTGPEEILATKKCKGAYTSTPFRGLAALAGVRELPIEVYSSMAVYQGDDTQFKPMYKNLEANDCIAMKGSVSQDALAGALRSAAFLVYPSIFPECHSIAILEAMAAGLKVITTDCAIEPNPFVDIMPASGSLDDYVKMLRKNINSFRSRPEVWAEKIWEQVQSINAEFTWKKKAAEWETYLTEILKRPQAA